MVDFKDDRTNVGGGPLKDEFGTEKDQKNIRQNKKDPKVKNENQKVDKIVEKPERKSKWC